ncbi:FAD-binding oxidoreductase [Streptomyces capitiformicae]|uniref:FAD-linked oxidase n=1 Tax=Streptomyces capitiformicae TaxID=2014920 RepID=A0A918ZK61_9ACTN|nr:FAD-binding protein [Streptomyces capitiformicae]GHE57515.1 FAD-linked oxidase [Streptomyces capitiformicae]
MSPIPRRSLIGGAAAAGGTLALPVAGASPARAAAQSATDEALRILRTDPRYTGFVSGANQRWVGSPDYIRLVNSTNQTVRAVQEAVDKGLRIAVRSGGHCNEPFVSDPAVRVVIDMSGMSRIEYDENRRAIAIEPGAMLGTVYRTLYKRWGIVLPGGTCPTVGVGGHIAGGGYGALSRSRGLTVDHLYAVEVVTVGTDGRARAVVATREPDDPNRELWWAHTGAGGGNFGVVTRYWLRSPDARGTDPAQLLPKAPSGVLLSDVVWSWDDLDERAFTRLIANYDAWHARNSAPDSPGRHLYSQLKVQHRIAGSFHMCTQVDASAPDAEDILDEFLAAVAEGTGATYRVGDRTRSPWMYAVTQWFGFVEAAMPRWKAKSAYVRKPMPQEQLKAMYRQLTRTDYENPTAVVNLISYGGRINAVASDATAAAQRDSHLKILYVSLWTDTTDDARHEKWVRECYQDVYASTGGVPRTDGTNDGCYINYADADLADPALNTSGIPWHQLYFKGNYPRLQRVKERWDPRDLFRHALAVRRA